MTVSKTQSDFDSVKSGGTLKLTSGEYPGPLVVRRSMTIEGNGATLWALRGPVLVVEAGARVLLKRLRVEVTGEHTETSSDEEVAIRVAPGGDLEMDDVEVRGSIEGLSAENGAWHYPTSLDLGRISPAGQHEFRLRIETAAPCKIESQVADIKVSPSSLPGGTVEVRLSVEQLINDTLLHGRILLKTATTKRWIVVTGHAIDSLDSIQPGSQSSPLWEPSESQITNTITISPVPTTKVPVPPNLKKPGRPILRKPPDEIIISLPPTNGPFNPPNPGTINSATHTSVSNAWLGVLSVWVGRMQSEWPRIALFASGAAAIVALLALGVSSWNKADEREREVKQLANEIAPLLENRDFQRVIDKVRPVRDDIAKDSRIISLVQKAKDGISEQEVEQLVQRLRGMLERGEATAVIDIIDSQLPDIASHLRIKSLLEAARKPIANKTSIDQLVDELTPLLDAGRYGTVVAKLGMVSDDIKNSPQILVLSKRAFQGSAFESICIDISKHPLDQDVKPLLEKARKLAQSEDERQIVEEWKKKWDSGRANEIMKGEIARQFEKGEFQHVIEMVRSASDDIKGDSKIKGFVDKAKEGVRNQTVEKLVPEFEEHLKMGEADVVVDKVKSRPPEIASDPRIKSLLETARKVISNKNAIDQLLKELAPLVEASNYETVIKKLETVSDEIKMAPQVSVVSKRAFQGRAFQVAYNDIEKQPFHQDVKPLVESARKLAQSERERQSVDERKKVWDSGRTAEITKYEKELAKVVSDAATFRDSTRQGRPTSDEKIQELGNRLSTLRSSFTKFGVPNAEIETADKSIKSIAAWREVTKRFSKLETDLRESKADEQSLTKLANHLNIEIAPIIPDSESKARAEKAKTSLPHWKSVLILQRSLQDLKSLKSDDWKGLPPAAVWPAGTGFMEVIRQRDSTVKGTAASDLKEYFKRPEIVDLWAFRQIGLEYPYYASKQPLPGGGNISVLLDENGPFVNQQFSGGLKGIQKAPQSLFAERVLTLWALPDTSNWHDEVAARNEALLDSKNMEPLLKLSLIRKFLALATFTSPGYAERLKTDAGYMAVMGPTAMIQGNWLDPNKNLGKQREAAEEFISKAPRLKSMAADAAKFDDQLFEVVQNGLSVPGRLSRDDVGKTVLARFKDSPEVTNGQLFVVLDGEWIEIGQMKAASAVCYDRAAQFLGWPVFSIRANK